MDVLRDGQWWVISEVCLRLLVAGQSHSLRSEGSGIVWEVRQDQFSIGGAWGTHRTFRTCTVAAGHEGLGFRRDLARAVGPGVTHPEEVVNTLDPVGLLPESKAHSLSLLRRGSFLTTVVTMLFFFPRVGDSPPCPPIWVPPYFFFLSHKTCLLF